MKRVLLLHDIAESERIGMLEKGSRYLISLQTLKDAIKLAESRMTRFEQLGNARNDKSPINDYVSITVDDGGGSSIITGEFLAERGIRATFFIVSQFIGKDGFLEKNEIQSLYAMGHKIGAHSHRHPNPFHQLSKNKILEEVIKCKLILEEIIEDEVDSFSVPGGEVHSETLITLQESSLGLKEIYTSTPYEGVYAGNSSTRIYGRVCIEANMNARTIANFCVGKGWKRAFIDYQVRRLRREVVYRFRNKSNVALD